MVDVASQTVGAPVREERRLAAVLVADVVGYSGMMEADEAGTLAAIRKLRADVIGPRLAEWRGRQVKLMGDGVIAEFPSVVDAVACAVAIQGDLAAQQNGLRLRIGINLGDVVVEGDDLYGDGVNVAARLEQIAEPGRIAVSGTVYDQLAGKLGLGLDYVGTRKVKNIERPVRVYFVSGGHKAAGPKRALRRPALVAAVVAVVAVVALAAGWLLRPGEAEARRVVAVLPFATFDDDPATRRLADGVTEDVITDLARFREFGVIARNSTATYQGGPDVREIGRVLGATHVLEGSLRRQGDSIRASAQLIDTATGEHVWTDRWDKPAEDVFEVQAEIAARVANEIGGWHALFDLDRTAARRKPPESLTAYDLYLLGVAAKHVGNTASLREAVDYLTRAVAVDPDFGRAWTGLAWAYNLLTHRVGEDEFAAVQKKSLEAAERAVAVDPSDAEAHSALGTVVGEAGDLSRAEAEMNRSLELNPNLDVVVLTYASWASSFGRPEQGAELADRYIRLDPNYPAWANSMLAYAYFNVGRYGEVVTVLSRAPLDTYAPGDLVRLAGALASSGRATQAADVVRKSLALYPDITIEGYASSPDFIESERARYIETMTNAGYPPCLDEAELAKLSNPARLLECDRKRAAAQAG